MSVAGTYFGYNFEIAILKITLSHLSDLMTRLDI